MIHDLCILMLTAGITSLVFKLLRQPVVLGYIVAGMLVGPHLLGQSWVSNEESVEMWGEIGVLFLLFSLGLEFSFKKLMQVGSTAINGAAVIMVGMMTIGFCVAIAMGWDSMNALFLGAMLCMSSTTIVFKSIDEAGLRSHRFAKVCFGILVVEDLLAVVLMVLLSSIAQKNSFEGLQLLLQVGKLLLYLAVWFAVGIMFIPSFLRRYRKHLNEETLTIFSVGLCLGMVLLAMEAGFSSALGAFVMGSLMAETIEAERIEHLVQPIKNVFGAIFFVSVGMMIDPSLLVKHWVAITIITLVVIIGQIVFGSIGTLISGQPLRVALQTGFSLVQIGEFAFIIAQLGITLRVTDASLYPIVVAVSVITTFLTPYIMRLAYPTLAFCERHISDETRRRMDEYAQNRQQGSSIPWNRLLGSVGRSVKQLFVSTPVAKQVVEQFNTNLYAREIAAEKAQAVQKETANMLLALDVHISEFMVAENSLFCGKALKDIDVRKHSGATIVGIVRHGINVNIPGGDHRIFPGDRLVVAGSDQQMTEFQQMLDDSEGEMPDTDSKITLSHIIVTENSTLCGKTILATDIRRQHKCIVMGIVKPLEDVYMNPDPSIIIEAGDTLIVAGEQLNIKALHES